MAAFVAVPFAAAAAIGLGYAFGGKFLRLAQLYKDTECKDILLQGNYTREEKEAIKKAAQAAIGLNALKINIGFCGQVKAGKSKLINSLRNVKKGSEDFAREGDSECTSVITGYPQKTDDKGSDGLVVLWDIPGSGTFDVPYETYFKDNYLYIFDVLLVMIGDTLRAEDIEFARLAQEHGIPWAFVKSKCDRELKSNARDAGIDVENFIMSGTLEAFMDAIDSCMEKENAVRDFQELKSEFAVQAHATLTEDLNRHGADLAGWKFFCISSMYIQHPKKYKEFEMDEKAFLQFIVEETCRRRGMVPQAEDLSFD